MKKLNLNEVYVSHNPKKFINLVIVDTAMTEDTHKAIDALNEFSSVFFIFKSGMKNIDFRKFTTLYGGCAFIIADESKLPIETFLKTLLYCKEIFENSYYGITYLSKLTPSLVAQYRTQLEKIAVKQVNAAIFDITRFTAEELSLFYTIDESTIVEDGMPKLNFWKKRTVDNDEILWDGYKTHYSKSSIITMPSNIVGKFLESAVSDNNVVKSFRDIGDKFESLASLFMLFRLPYVNSDLLTLEI